MSVLGGGLPASYTVAQIHFHWSGDNVSFPLWKKLKVKFIKRYFFPLISFHFYIMLTKMVRFWDSAFMQNELENGI